MSKHKVAHIIRQNNKTMAVVLGSLKFAKAECERMKRAAYKQFCADRSHQPGTDGFFLLDEYQLRARWHIHYSIPITDEEEKNS